MDWLLMNFADKGEHVLRRPNRRHDQESKVITLTQEELRHLQLVMLELLDEVDRICRKNNIEYRIDGGTLLGAVRHHGFIPWDDDVDVTMQRSEYDRFCVACKKDLNSKYFLQTWDTDPYQRQAYAHLMKKGTKLVKLHHEHDKMQNGIHIDIFPYDYLPEDKNQLKRIHTLDVQMQRVIYAPGVIQRDSSVIKKAAFCLYGLYPMGLLKKQHKQIVEKLNQKKTKITKCFGFTGYRDIYGFPSKAFDELIELEFEGKEYMAPKGYDEFLTRLYGDYMTLPSEEKRKSKVQVVEIEFGD